MTKTKNLLIIMAVTLFFVASFIPPASSEPYFNRIDTITVPEGNVAADFKVEFNVDSGTEGIPFYLWSWKIVNSDYSPVYYYYDGNPPEELGRLSQLVLCPGTYYIYLDQGKNTSVDVSLKYEFFDDMLHRYVIPSRHHGYTVYDFDYEPMMFSSGDCGYFNVNYSNEPYFFMHTPSYIRLDDRYEAHYFDTPEGYYIFDGRNGEPILYDMDDEVIIVDDGDGRIVIVEDNEKY